MDEFDPRMTAFAHPGDVVFVRCRKSKHVVRTTQRLRGIPHADWVHVAVVISQTELMEANWGKKASTEHLSIWHQKREEDERELIVFRHPSMELSEKVSALQEAAIYWLRESYALWDIAVAPQKPSPEGRSVCSVLVAKILCKARLIDQDSLATQKQVFPGELLQFLKDSSWQEIKVAKGYFYPERNIAGEFVPKFEPVRDMARLFEEMRALDEAGKGFDQLSLSNSANLAEMLEQYDPCVFFRLAWASSENHVFQYMNMFIEEALSASIAMLADRELPTPANWETAKGSREATDLKKDRCDRSYDNLYRLFGKFREGLDGLDVTGQCAMRCIKEIKVTGNVSESALQHFIESYLELSVKFSELTGKTAHQFIHDSHPVVFELDAFDFPFDPSELMSLQDCAQKSYDMLLKETEAIARLISGQEKLLGMLLSEGCLEEIHNARDIILTGQG